MCRVWRRRETHTEFWWGNLSERSTFGKEINWETVV
jgi:hypothetical protein